MISQSTNFALELYFTGVLPQEYSSGFVNSISYKRYVNQKEDTLIQKNLYYKEILDVPSYLQTAPRAVAPEMTLQKVGLYEGYLVDLTKYQDLDDLLLKRFKKNSRKNLRAKLRALEKERAIRYEFYWGAIAKQEYDALFEACYQMMKARFKEKKIHNRFLLNWQFFYDMFYPMVIAKEASITVVYDDAKPITITLNFHRADIVFSFIQIFDVSYKKFSLGDIAMLKNLEWSYRNNFSCWDVSKGKTEYKRRWCNLEYLYQSHIFYNPNSLRSKLKLKYRCSAIKLKGFLRQKGIIGGVFQLDRLYYFLYRRKLKNHSWRVSSKNGL